MVYLSHELVWNRSQELRLIIFSRHYMSCLGFFRESLAGCSPLARSLGLLLSDLVGVNSVKEILSALAVLDMLHSDIDSLGQDLATDSLVDHNTHGSLGHIEHAASLAVVGLVWHTLLEGTAA